MPKATSRAVGLNGSTAAISLLILCNFDIILLNIVSNESTNDNIAENILMGQER